MTASSSAAAATLGVLVLLGVFGSSVALAAGEAGFSPPRDDVLLPAPRSVPRAVSHRKLLAEGGGRGRAAGGTASASASTQRVDDGCSADDIAIYQGATKPLPSGIPTYTVDVINECVASDGHCAIAHIHVRCGWFSSVHLTDPRLFRRLGFDDCLLNDGHPLRAGDSISFMYANSFPYKMSVSSASCLGTP